MSTWKKHDKAVCGLFDRGLKGREIAAHVGISESTVWGVLRRCGKEGVRRVPNTGMPATPLAELRAKAKPYGSLYFDDAELPNGGMGFIAFVGDRPGMVCANKIAALKSALVAVGAK